MHRVDLDWKAAMGGDDDFMGIGATTFSLFRARLVVDDADRHLFEKTLEAAMAAGILKGRRNAIIDSSPVHGAGAVADTYELLGDFLVWCTGPDAPFGGSWSTMNVLLSGPVPYSGQALKVETRVRPCRS